MPVFLTIPGRIPSILSIELYETFRGIEFGEIVGGAERSGACQPRLAPGDERQPAAHYGRRIDSEAMKTSVALFGRDRDPTAAIVHRPPSRGAARRRDQDGA